MFIVAPTACARIFINKRLNILLPYLMEAVCS